MLKDWHNVKYKKRGKELGDRRRGFGFTINIHKNELKQN